MSLHRACCCERYCITDDGGDILRHGGDPVDYGWPGAVYDGMGGYIEDRTLVHPKCHRLYVWERRAVTGGVYGGASAADHILKTNKYGVRIVGAFPGTSEPFETSPGSGVLLDTEPYYWIAPRPPVIFPTEYCEVGGYETVASMWYQPTLAQIQGIMDPVDAAGISDPYTLPDGTYTLLALVRYSHVQKAGIDGGAVVVPDTDGQVMVISIRHIQHS